MKKSITLISCSLILLLLILACSKDDTTNPTGNTSPLIGKWNLVSITYNGTALSFESGWFTFFESMNFSAEYKQLESAGSGTLSGTWEEESNVLRITITQSTNQQIAQVNQTVSCEYSIDDNILTMNYLNLGDDTYIEKYQKSE